MVMLGNLHLKLLNHLWINSGDQIQTLKGERFWRFKLITPGPCDLVHRKAKSHQVSVPVGSSESIQPATQAMAMRKVSVFGGWLTA